MRGQGQWIAQYMHLPARALHWNQCPDSLRHCWHLAAAGTKRTSEDAASPVAGGASLESVPSSLEDIDSSSLDNAKKENRFLAKGTPLELAA